MTNISQRDKMYLSLQMPEYAIAMSSLKDKMPSEVFAPQYLLNNPITDPEHSQYVQHYLQQRLGGKDEVREELKTSNISVRKDLLIPKILESKINNKRAYEEIDLSNDSEDETEQDILKHAVHGKRTIDICAASSFKRKTRNRDDMYLEPASKTSKTETVAIKRLSHGDSAIRKKIHLDCLVAMKQDLNGN